MIRSIHSVSSKAPLLKRGWKSKIFNKKLLILGLVILLIALFFQFGKLAKFSQIKVVNQTNCLSADKLKSFYTKANLFTDLKTIKQKILQQNPCLKDINTKINLQKELTVEAVPRIPMATVSLFKKDIQVINPTLTEATPSTQAAVPTPVPQIQETVTPLNLQFLTDTDGVLFLLPTAPDNLYPIKLINYSLRAGERIPDQLMSKISKILTKLAIDFSFNQITLDDSNLQLQVIEKVEPDKEKSILFALNRDIDKQTASLQLILQKAKIDSKQLQKIDLRFDKPVVVYTN